MILVVIKEMNGLELLLEEIFMSLDESAINRFYRTVNMLLYWNAGAYISHYFSLN